MGEERVLGGRVRAEGEKVQDQKGVAVLELLHLGTEHAVVQKGAGEENQGVRPSGDLLVLQGERRSCPLL